MRLALTARDRGCTFPGCDRPRPGPTPTTSSPTPTAARPRSTTAPSSAATTTANSPTRLARPMINGRPHWIPPTWIDPTQTPRRITSTTHPYECDTSTERAMFVARICRLNDFRSQERRRLPSRNRSSCATARRAPPSHVSRLAASGRAGRGCGSGARPDERDQHESPGRGARIFQAAASCRAEASSVAAIGNW